jgi:hypothetical protein
MDEKTLRDDPIYKIGRTDQLIDDLKFLGDFIKSLKEEARSLMVKAKLNPKLTHEELVDMKAKVDGCFGSVALVGAITESIAKINKLDLKKEGLSPIVREEKEDEGGKIIQIERP